MTFQVRVEGVSAHVCFVHVFMYCSDMFQCPFIQMLTGSDTQRIDVRSLPVVEDCTEQTCEQLVSAVDGENLSPFTFTPQRFRLNKDDELLEVLSFSITSIYDVIGCNKSV